MVAGGIAVDQCSGGEADQPKKPGVTDVSGGQSGVEGDPDDDDEPWSTNLIDSDKFDKSPLEYVDVDQCRALLFRMTGDPNCKALTADEMRQKIHEIETEERLVAAEDMIDQLCISNLEDQDMIRNATLNGCIALSEDSLYQADGEWYLSLGDKWGDEYCDNFELYEAPPASCRRALTEEEKKDNEESKKRQEKIKEMERLIKDNQFDDVLKDIDISRLEDEVRYEGLEGGIGGELIDMLKRVKHQMEGEMDSEKRKILACELFSFLISLEGFKRSEDETDPARIKDMQTMGNNQVIINTIEAFFAFAEALLDASELNDPEECLLYMHKR